MFIINGAFNNIVDQLGLQHHILDEIGEGLGQILPVIEGNVHVDGPFL